MTKRVLLVGLFLLICFQGDVRGQNKTLGVGVTTPNPNAVLHVESPTGNQGFILPRLSTAQRTAPSFTSVLKDSDKGLLVYDTNLNTIYIWNGIMWKSSAQVAGGPKLLLPYADTIMASAPDNSSLLNIIYAASASQNVSVAKFQNMNGANTGAALYVSTNGIVGAPATASAAILGETSTAFSAITGRATGGWSNGLSGISASADPGSYAILGSNSGGGPAGVFTQTLTTNATTAFQATTSGIGGAGKFQVNNVASTGPALWAETNSNQPLSAAYYGVNTGSGDVAASFKINNAANTFAAAFAETNGAGPAIFGNQMGTGRGGQFQIGNATNNNAAVRASTNGTGNSGFYTINNTESTSAGVFSTTNGRGAAIHGQNIGTADGFAGLFEITRATNTFPAIQATTVGSGSGVRVFQDLGIGAGIDVFMRNTTTTAPGVLVDQLGLGSAANFLINNASNASSALSSTTNGTGAAFTARHTGANGDAIYAENQTSGTGSAGNFRVSNGSNNASSLFGVTNAAGGTGIGASNEGNGVALAVWSGGMKITTEVVTNATIANRAMAYQITSGGTVFTFSFAPSKGEIFMVYNETGALITVAGVAINNNEGKTLINFDGSFRGF